ncbi:MFS transporter [Oxynema sp. CENA135]|nr:MFS transporter [Oxynema sp. CENA135]
MQEPTALNAFEQLEPNRRNSLTILFGSGLLFWASIASLLPTLPLYVEDLGGTKAQIGLVMGAFALGLLPSRPWLGPLADRRGRKLVLWIGAAVVAIAPLGYLAIDSIPLLMVLRAFHGISIAAFTTGYSALVTDLSPPQRRGELVGYMSLVNPLGVAIGPAIGGFLQASLGYTPLFLMSFALGSFSWLTLFAVEEPPREVAEGAGDRLDPERSESFWRLLASPQVRIPSFVMLTIGLVFGTIATFIPLYIKSANIDLNPGFFYTAAAIASFSLRLFTGRASDRYGRGLFITGGLICYLVAMLGLWQAHSPIDILGAAFIEGCGAGTLIPMMVVLMADRCQPHQRGRFFALCIGGFDLGIALAGPILGAIAQDVGYRNMFGIAASMAAIALVTFVTQSSQTVKQSVRFALGRSVDVYAVKNGL